MDDATPIVRNGRFNMNGSSPNDTNRSVQLLIGNSYSPIPSSEARLDRTKVHRKIHDWTLFVDVVDGNPDIIEDIKFDLPSFEPRVFTCSTPVSVNRQARKIAWRFKTRQQSYGAITATITIRGVGGSIDTHSYRLILSKSELQKSKSPLLDFHEKRNFRPMKMIKIPNMQKFGVELELTSAMDLHHQIIASTLETRNCKVDVMDYQSGRSTSENWKIVPDSSIVCSVSLPDCNKFELVSPILYGGSGLQTINQILKKLNNLQPKLKVNKSMGFHVHVDVSNFSVNQLVKICQNFIKYEQLIDTFMPPSRRHGSSESSMYFRSNRSSVAKHQVHMTNRQFNNVLGRCTSIRSLVEVMNRDGRYYKLNLTNLTNEERYQPTIEFRQHAATMNYEKVGAWVRFCVAFCNNSARLPAPSSFKQNKPLLAQFDALFQYVVKDRALRDFYRKRQEDLSVGHQHENDPCCTSCVRGKKSCERGKDQDDVQFITSMSSSEILKRNIEQARADGNIFEM